MYNLCILSASANVNVEDFISECVVMKDFDHPNVLGLVGIYFNDSSGLPLIVLPYMANGDLRTFLRSKRDFTRDSTILEFPNVSLLCNIGNCVMIMEPGLQQWSY